MRRGLVVLGVIIGSLLVAGGAAAQVVLRGTVRDGATDQVLEAAHIVDEATGRGTITNREGRFEFVVSSLPVTLRVRYIGYDTAFVTVDPDDDRTLSVALVPIVYALGEVFVAGDDFAANVMRKVIARKERVRRELRTYAARGYSRFTLENDGRITLLSETVFDRYWERSRGRRTVIRSRRETATFYTRLGMDPSGSPANLYDDEIEVQGLTFIGPTHPDALDYYTFTLAERRALGDRMVYEMYVAPKNGLDATFVGRLAVLDSVYVLLDADLRPARHVVFPAPVDAWDVFYRQQFAAVADSFWLPVDLRLDGTFHVDPDGQGYPPGTLQQVTRFDEYRVNGPVPEDVYAGTDLIQVDSQSVFQDQLFLLGQNIIPLTPRELVALEQLRFAEMTLERAFPPRRGGVLAAFDSRRYEIDGPQFGWPLILGYEPWLRFNRVDGYFTGIGQVLRFDPRLAVELRVAQTFGLRRVRFLGRTTMRWGRGGTLESGYARDTSPRNTSLLYSPTLNSWPALLNQGDYFDWYWNERGWLRLGYATRWVRVSVQSRVEQHEAVRREWRRPWPGSETMRSNPAVPEGRFVSIGGTIAMGDGYEPIRTGPSRRVELRVERGLPGMLGGEFAFTQAIGLVDGSVRTFYRNRLRPNRLEVRAVGSTSWGDLPLQRLAGIDGSLGGFSAFGALRTLRDRPYEGERTLGLFWAHDFSTAPFEWLGLQPLVDRTMGVRVFGGHAHTVIDEAMLRALAFTPRQAAAWHHEVGLALTNVWGWPLRLDVATRLDAPGVYVGFGLSRGF